MRNGQTCEYRERKKPGLRAGYGKELEARLGEYIVNVAEPLRYIDVIDADFDLQTNSRTSSAASSMSSNNSLPIFLVLDRNRLSRHSHKMLLRHRQHCSCRRQICTPQRRQSNTIAFNRKAPT